MDLLKGIEDIYPLTIVNTRFGGYIIIFNVHNSHPIIERFVLEEELQYDIVENLKKEVNFDFHYGVGTNIYEAYLDFKQRRDGK